MIPNKNLLKCTNKAIKLGHNGILSVETARYVANLFARDWDLNAEESFKKFVFTKEQSD